MSKIAIVGMACRYAEVRSPLELWQNVLAQRRSFRPIPRLRLNLADYSDAHEANDVITDCMAAVLEDYEFDRVRFRVSSETFKSTDLAHWLALDVASQALNDFKFPVEDEDLHERTGVFVGNTLTGEFSRANLMRLRWPYVRRVIAAALQKESAVPESAKVSVMDDIESIYKAPFPPTTEDSLAGGLSNTIAGRICNYFNFKGGGYTVDGACASSLLAIANACSALESGDIDLAVAGGVDLSLDPFEMAGFSKLGAIAGDKMRVFDQQSAGFWPGEGCGFVVLMRQDDALARNLPVTAVIRGWGISSDGSGGMTRPEISGQLLAIQRAYQRAAYGIDSVGYFEAHGTGTSVGDAVELQALSRARRQANGNTSAVAIGSIKANIGHTKAAAGVAGLIKAAMALETHVIPPTTGCEHPHLEIAGVNPALRIVQESEKWPEGPRRAGVSAFGFGGINVHITLEASEPVTARGFGDLHLRQDSCTQDCELFLFEAPTIEELALELNQLRAAVAEISYGEMTDLAAALANRIDHSSDGVRAAIVAADPQELQSKLERLREWCSEGLGRKFDCENRLFFCSSPDQARVGYLFPGQASPVYTDGGAWTRRFKSVRQLYEHARLPKAQTVATDTAQPCIVTASLAGLQMLRSLGIEASVAAGHSLGEITALYWAGAFETEEELLRVVAERGKLMAELGSSGGVMASINAPFDDVRRRLNGDPIVIAAHNSEYQTVVSGEARAVQKFAARMNGDGFSSTLLPVSHAFHSPLMAAAAGAFARYLSSSQLSIRGTNKRIVSTVTGAALQDDTDLRQLLTTQVTAPVRFADAISRLLPEADLLIEVGPGKMLTGIVKESARIPVVALDAGSESLRGLLGAAGAAYVAGVKVDLSVLFKDRFFRPFDLRRRHSFFQNPCEEVPESFITPRKQPASPASAPILINTPSARNTFEVLRQLLAQRTELPPAAIRPEHRFLDDIHLNSITVSQIMLQAAAQCGAAPPLSPTEYSNATIAEASAILEQNRGHVVIDEKNIDPPGAEPWIRALQVEWVESPLRGSIASGEGQWQIIMREPTAFTNAVVERLKDVPGSGAVCFVPKQRDLASATFLLSAARQCVQDGIRKVVLVQESNSAAGFARSFFLENPAIAVKVINLPDDHQDPQCIANEAAFAAGFTELRYSGGGVRYEPRLKVAWPELDVDQDPLTASDLLLVTGGGKGIASECARELALRYKCRLVLMGRSDAEQDDDLKNNLKRFVDAGIRFKYYSVDLTDETATADALRKVHEEVGSVTAILHGAGTNNPKRLEALSERDVIDTLNAKVISLRNILSVTNPADLRLLLTFGSIIGRLGLHGEAHYALANEWLRLEAQEWQRNHPDCRCLNLEWSVWAGTGMGQRLGVLEALQRQGIIPLPLDEAIAQLSELIQWKDAPQAVIITSRTGSLKTFRFAGNELPLLRFLEKARVHYPGIEIVADSIISVDTDPYLNEHCLHGEAIYPAVMGMEAMAQAASALEPGSRLQRFQNLRFKQPIVAPKEKAVQIRVAAVRRQAGLVAVVVRCSATSFLVDHFSAECVFGESAAEAQATSSTALPKALSLDPVSDLYDRILFHEGRFQRISAYHELQARRCACDVSGSTNKWFGRYLPGEMLLGDAAARDAAIHCIQACIPHKTVLPAGVEAVEIYRTWTSDAAIVRAEQISQEGDDFIYDVEIENATGSLCERWKGLRLHAVAALKTNTPWNVALLVPYLERRLAEFLPEAELKIALAAITDRHRGERIAHRPDGKPENPSAPQVEISRSHASGLCLTVRSKCTVGCDLEDCVEAGETNWEHLLGVDGFGLAEAIAGRHAISLSLAATQVWALKESLRKSGSPLNHLLQIERHFPDGWTLLSSGSVRAAIFQTHIQGFQTQFAFGFASRQAR